MAPTEEELAEIGLPPPFWAFAWAGGQGLARYVLDHPELVRGKRVLDFATGSGLVAIAAAKAGAASVLAVDIDPFCAAAVALNAELNGVGVAFDSDDLIGETGDWDVVLAGDVFYDRAFADRLGAVVRGALPGVAPTSLVGDPGRSYLPKQRLDRACGLPGAGDARAGGCRGQDARRSGAFDRTLTDRGIARFLAASGAYRVTVSTVRSDRNGSSRAMTLADDRDAALRRREIRPGEMEEDGAAATAACAVDMFQSSTRQIVVEMVGAAHRLVAGARRACLTGRL